MSDVEVAVEAPTIEQVDVAVPAGYRVIRELGKGGFATTYEAERLSDGVRVAIKALDVSDIDDWKSVELFEREARVLAGLDHPGIPRYLDYVPPEEQVDGAHFFLIQELAPGRSLGDRMAAGWRADEATVRDIARQTLEILDYLHAQQSPAVIHRDIKPDNLVCEDLPDGGVKVRLVDFGAVKDTIVSHSRVAGSTVVGTYGYMAPEQFQGRAEAASDLYGLGATLVHLLTGTAPADLPHKRLKVDFQEHANASGDFERWIDTLIEPALEDRPASAEAALYSLLSSGSSRPAEPPPAKVKRPVGTSIDLERTADKLSVSIVPPKDASILFEGGFAFAWLAFIAFWTGSSISMGAPIIFPLFSIPFWIVGGFMGSKVLNKIGGKVELDVGPEAFELRYKLFGVTRKTVRGATADLEGLSQGTPSGFMRKIPGADIGESLLLNEGIRGHALGPTVTDMELDWLQSELAAFQNR